MIKATSRESFLEELNKQLPYSIYGIEIGVLDGEFSEMILTQLKPEFLALIDPFAQSEETYGEDFNYLATAYSTETQYQNLLTKFNAEIEKGQVFVDRKFSHEAVKDYPDDSFDLIYHDGSHKYEDIKRDLVEWVSKIKHNGIIAGHDYTEYRSFGVIKAVNEFMEEYNFEMFLFNKNGGDWALKRKQ